MTHHVAAKGETCDVRTEFASQPIMQLLIDGVTTQIVTTTDNGSGVFSGGWQALKAGSYGIEFLPKDGEPQIILLGASALAAKTAEHIAAIKKAQPNTPIILVIEAGHPEMEGLLALPVAEFHEANAGPALLKQRIRSALSRNEKAAPQDAWLGHEEAELWRTLFNAAGAGMLTGRFPKAKGSGKHIFTACPGSAPNECTDCVRENLHSVGWELANEQARNLLDLEEPVAMDSTFIDRLTPINPQQCAVEMAQLGGLRSMCKGTFSLERAHGEPRYLSLEITAPDNLDEVILFTVIDITQEFKLEQNLRDHVNLLETRVEERTQAIRMVNNQLEDESRQRRRLSAQVRESLAHITQGVISAKKILEVALPGRAELKSIFPHSILISRPRDIMGGDFLFTAEKDGRKTIALIDSTGHGIPGAMVSLMGSTLINRAFVSLQNPSPARILQHFLDGFKQRMNVTSGSPQMYGFDAGVLTVDTTTNTLEYAGARGDLYLVRNGETRIFRGTRSSIEIQQYLKQDAQMAEFATHSIDIHEGDQVYLVTDGVRDQFGGEYNRKLGRKRLADLLARHANLPLNEREKAMQQALLIWKGANTKVDDATLVGLEF